MAGSFCLSERLEPDSAQASTSPSQADLATDAITDAIHNLSVADPSQKDDTMRQQSAENDGTIDSGDVSPDDQQDWSSGEDTVLGDALDRRQQQVIDKIMKSFCTTLDSKISVLTASVDSVKIKQEPIEEKLNEDDGEKSSVSNTKARRRLRSKAHDAQSAFVSGSTSNASRPIALLSSLRKSRAIDRGEKSSKDQPESQHGGTSDRGHSAATDTTASQVTFSGPDEKIVHKAEDSVKLSSVLSLGSISRPLESSLPNPLATVKREESEVYTFDDEEEEDNDDQSEQSLEDRRPRYPHTRSRRHVVPDVQREMVEEGKRLKETKAGASAAADNLAPDVSVRGTTSQPSLLSQEAPTASAPPPPPPPPPAAAKTLKDLSTRRGGVGSPFKPVSPIPAASKSLSQYRPSPTSLSSRLPPAPVFVPAAFGTSTLPPPPPPPRSRGSIPLDGLSANKPKHAGAADTQMSVLEPKPCLDCKSGKLLCDGSKPSCSTCSRLGHPCTYEEVRRKRGPKRGSVEDLEEPSQQVETVLKNRDNGQQVDTDTPTVSPRILSQQVSSQGAMDALLQRVAQQEPLEASASISTSDQAGINTQNQQPPGTNERQFSWEDDSVSFGDSHMALLPPYASLPAQPSEANAPSIWSHHYSTAVEQTGNDEDGAAPTSEEQPNQVDFFGGGGAFSAIQGSLQDLSALSHMTIPPEMFAGAGRNLLTDFQNMMHSSAALSDGWQFNNFLHAPQVPAPPQFPAVTRDPSTSDLDWNNFWNKKPDPVISRKREASPGIIDEKRVSSAPRVASKGEVEVEAEDHDGRRKKPRRETTNSVSALGGVGGKFACPYYKRNPRKYRNWTSCPGPGWEEVHRVKTHLYRRHTLPTQCPRCWDTFKTDTLLQAHIQQDPPCVVKQNKLPHEGFTKDQEKKLRSRKKTQADMTDEDKWREIYLILFPDDDTDSLPTPYYDAPEDDDAGTPAAGSGSGSELEDYASFVRREMPTLVRRELEALFHNELADVEARLMPKVEQIVLGLQPRLMSLYKQSQTPLSEYGPGQQQQPLTPASPGQFQGYCDPGTTRSTSGTQASIICCSGLISAQSTPGRSTTSGSRSGTIIGSESTPEKELQEAFEFDGFPTAGLGGQAVDLNWETGAGMHMGMGVQGGQMQPVGLDGGNGLNWDAEFNRMLDPLAFMPRPGQLSAGGYQY